MNELTDEQRVQRAHSAKRALEEFLEPAFEVVETEYAGRLASVCASKPWATNEIAALANAGRIVKEVRNQVAALVVDGADAQARIDRAKTIGALSPAKKRLLNIGQI